jgi:hypothetical protein
MMYLSKDGMVALRKSTLSNLSTYFMSLFLLPASVANHTEKLHQNFLWGGIGEKFKYHLVSWFKVASPIFEGGLGVRNLRMFNCALSGKWLWRYVHEREAWWRVVVDFKIAFDPLGHLGRSYGRILGGGGEYFLVIPNLSREMTQRSNSKIMCDVGRWPLRKHSQNYISLLV